MSLAIQIFDTPSKDTLLADFTSRLHPAMGGRGLRFSTGPHGFSGCDLPIVPMDLHESFSIYDWPGTPYIVVSDEAAAVAWEGRLEDINIVPSGVGLGGFGYWRALRDVPYTAMWSMTGIKSFKSAVIRPIYIGDSSELPLEWIFTTEDDLTENTPAKFNFDTNNRLYISLKKDQKYGVAQDYGALYLKRPHLSDKWIKEIEYTIDVDLPAGFVAQLISYTGFGFTGGTTESSPLSNGSFTTTLSDGKRAVAFRVVNATAADPYTNTAEDDRYYLKVTGIRIRGTDSNSVFAHEIVNDLISYVNGINSSQLQSSTVLVETTSADLKDEIYEDEYPADILDRLALLHGYEVGVWEDRRLHFRPKGSAGQHWFVDVTRIISLERSLEELRNSAYATYRDASGRTLRTAVANDQASIDRYGITRRGVINVQTTSQTEAETHRDTFLTDRSDFVIRAEIEFDRLFDANGAEHPLYRMRSGDKVTMRNLPPTLSTDIDNIRTFLTAETEYSALNNKMSLEPQTPIPTLVTLVSRREAGITR